jgi:nickel-dependent lactate racemase
MWVGIDYGHERLELEIREEVLVGTHRAPPVPNLTDPAAAARAALEAPLGFPALRRALTPDDHVAVVVDERLPRLADLLTGVLEHVTQAHVVPAAITVVCLPPSTGQPWVEALPEAFEDVRVEVHDPADRKRLSYLAATRQGRRIYLNRTVVDADQVVVVTRRGYDALLGYSGGAEALYPALSDEATRKEARARLSMQTPVQGAWPLRREAAEVAWLLGAPFFLQVVEGAGGTLAHVLGGLIDTDAEAQRLLDARWRIDVARPAALVVAAVGGDPARHDCADMARAAACAARVVQRGGRIVLLTASAPALGEACALLRQADDPDQALQALRQHPEALDQEAAFQWASAAGQAHIYLLSKLAAETTEELFAVALEHAGQAQRLVAEAGSCLLLPDAHQSLAVLRS